MLILCGLLVAIILQGTHNPVFQAVMNNSVCVI